MKHRPLSVIAVALGVFSSVLPLRAQEAGHSSDAATSRGPSAGAHRTGPTDPAELEAFLDGAMHVILEQFHSAGATVSVVSGGELFFAKGYGYTDWEAHTPVDPETTLFRIGSVSKLFVWTSVMQMVEQGLLDLDTDINEYLDFEIPEAFDEPVTLAGIMAHAGGFEDYVFGLFSDDTEDLRPLGEILADQLPARVRPPGDISSYSNHATGMAAHIVELASGTEWGDYIEANVLTPLSMEHTTFRQPVPEHLSEHLSQGFRYRSGTFEAQDFEYIPLFPVGAASASATDMARFMIAHLQLGRLGDARILSEETARLMHSDHHRMAPAANAMVHGFVDHSQHGVRIIGHGGDTRLFHTGLWLFPDQDLGLFVSFNSAGAGGARAPLFQAFMDRYFPVDVVAPDPPEDFADRAQRFTGDYRANRFSYTTVAKVSAVQTNSIQATDRGTLRALGAEWVEESPLVFREVYGPRTLVFRENEAGEITHFFLSSAPYVAFERPPVSEHPALNIPLFILVAVTILLTLLAPPVGWGIRRWYRIPSQEVTRIPRGARITIWSSALFFALGAILFFANAATGRISSQDPFAPFIAFSLLILGAVLAVLSLAFAVRLWKPAKGRFAVRLLYSGAALSLCLFIWQLNAWNLIGWNY